MSSSNTLRGITERAQDESVLEHIKADSVKGSKRESHVKQGIPNLGVQESNHSALGHHPNESLAMKDLGQESAEIQEMPRENSIHSNKKLDSHEIADRSLSGQLENGSKKGG